MSKENKQSDEAFRRGISVSAVQKQKSFVREESVMDSSLEHKATKIVVHESEEAEREAPNTNSYFETLRLDVDNYAPKNDSMRIIVRDVAEVKPEIENIVAVLPEAKATDLEVKGTKTIIPEVKIAEPKVENIGPIMSEPEILKPEIIVPDNNISEIILNNKKAEVIEPTANIEVSSRKVESTESVRMATRVSRSRRVTPEKLSAKDLKEREISRAIKNASKLPENRKGRAKKGLGFGWVRTALVVSCIATGFFAIAYFVNLSANDMSLKVAAIQSGIEAVYPSYIPREFALSDVTASNGKILMNFKNAEGGAYSISEENSNWDSTALLNNYIKEEYGENYTVVKEQGLTLYMGENWEAWVNGGLLYKLKVSSGSLTKKQLKAIATSL